MQMPGSVRGRVQIQTDGVCFEDAPSAPIAGVVVELLDEDGQPVATTRTDEDGQYEFTGLRPALYSVREQQPTGFFHGGQRLQHLVGNRPTGGEALLHKSKERRNRLIIQADCTADTEAALRLLVEAVKGK